MANRYQTSNFQKLCTELKGGERNHAEIHNLHYGTLSEERYNTLLQSCKTVKTLRFHIYLSKSMLVQLAKWMLIQKPHSLEELSMDYCGRTLLDFMRPFQYDGLSLDSLRFSFHENFDVAPNEETTIHNFFSNIKLKRFSFESYEDDGHHLNVDSRRVTMFESVLTGVCMSKSIVTLELHNLPASIWGEISTQLLTHFFQRNKVLQRVILIGEMSCKGIEKLFTAIDKSHSNRLHIHIETTGKEALSQLFQKLSTTNTIERLTLKGNHIPLECLNMIASCLAMNSTIRALALHNNNPSQAGGNFQEANYIFDSLAPALKHHPSLQSLQISARISSTNELMFTNNGCDGISKCLNLNPRLRKIGFPIQLIGDATALIQMLPRLNTLQTLDIFHSPQIEAALKSEVFICALKRNASIVSLNFHSNRSKVTNERNNEVTSILKRNMAKRLVTKSLHLLAEHEEQWAPILSEFLSSRKQWLDAAFIMNRELVLQRR